LRLEALAAKRILFGSSNGVPAPSIYSGGLQTAILAKSQSVCGQRNECHLRAFRALFGLLAFFDATAPRIRKSSADFPPLIAAVNHFGLNQRPAQVSAGFCGFDISAQPVLVG
jgi:hypothetical protein